MKDMSMKINIYLDYCTFFLSVPFWMTEHVGSVANPSVTEMALIGISAQWISAGEENQFFDVSLMCLGCPTTPRPN